MQRRRTLAALIALTVIVVCAVVLGGRELRAKKTAHGALEAPSGGTELGAHAASSPQAAEAPERAHEAREPVRDERTGSPRPAPRRRPKSSSSRSSTAPPARRSRTRR
jgi:hypothetical protein